MVKKLESTSRLEAFSDGVIAVIITIMVLELKVPARNGLSGLTAVLPILSVYLLSFTFTGIYWVNHDHLLKRIDTPDKLTLYANLGFLFCLSLLPFFTSYVLEKKADGSSVAVYAASMVVTGFSFLLLRMAVVRNLRFFGDLRAEDSQAQRKHLASLGLYLIAVCIAHWHSYVALGITAVVTAIWIIPNLSVDDCVVDTSAPGKTSTLQQGRIGID
jgi:uncharacterized membrane protein